MLKTVSSITNAIGALNYVGTWNASTNTPTLTSSVGTKGDYYQVSVAGSTSINGISNWGVGDVIAFNGSTWQRIEGGADGNFVNMTATGNGQIDGVLGIGGAAKAWILKAVQIAAGSIYGAGNETGFYANAYYSSAGWRYINNGFSSGYIQNGGIHQWYTAASGSADAAASYTQTMQLDAGGSAYNITGTWGTFSDIKIKENVADATPKLDDLLKVRVVNYNRIGSTSKEIGVIAQELEQVFPALVSDQQDFVDGKPTGTTTKAVKYSVFVPMLIKAIQEQQDQINNLKADIAALKGN
jgi:hypothetical protein